MFKTYSRRIILSFDSLKADIDQTIEMMDDDTIECLPASPESNYAAALANDIDLVQRCIRGEVLAWEEIYHKCHDPLCTAIRIRLGILARDPHLVDEIAARSWYAIIEKDGAKLRKYDPKRGAGILTFLKLIAYDEISRYILSNQRRIKREMVSQMRKGRSKATTSGESMTAALSEFLVTLSPREQAFCREHLLLVEDENGVQSDFACSATNIRQITHRIYKKFLNFIGHSSSQ
jgi:hypothetical protein